MDFLGVAQADAAHEHARAGDALDEQVIAEAVERDADGSAADVEGLGEAFLVDLRAGGKLAEHDGLPEAVVQDVLQRLVPVKRQILLDDAVHLIGVH